MATVDIIMTAYNTSRFLAEAIESVIAQTFKDWRLLVCDDASTDGSWEIIQRFAQKDNRILPFRNSENLHLLHTRNNLLKSVSAKYITFLDSDDYMHPKRLEIQCGKLEHDTELLAIGCQAMYIKRNRTPIRIQPVKPVSYRDIVATLPIRQPVIGSTLMIKTKTMLELGGYREYFSKLGSEDYDLVSRLVEIGKVENLNERLYYYRQYSGSTSKRQVKVNPYKLHSAKIVRLLIEQRKKNGCDSLMEKKPEVIAEKVSEWHSLYLKHPSQYSIDLASAAMGQGNIINCFANTLKAIASEPFRLYNWRTLSYFIKAVFNTRKRA